MDKRTKTYDSRNRHKSEKRGKHFVRRVKERWDTKFPIVSRTAQTLIDSAKMGKGCNAE